MKKLLFILNLYLCVCFIYADIDTSVTGRECVCKEANEEGITELSCDNMFLKSIPNLDGCNREKIDLSSNEISNISDASFATFPQLKVLLLSTNKIYDLEKGVFRTLLNLREIDLSENGLLTIDPDIFIFNTRLENVKLAGNPLVDISTTSPILNANSIVNLDLHNCKLTNINKEMFSNFPHLERLDLSYNNIQSLSPAMFEASPQLRRLEINNNRWKCGCNLKGIVDFSKEIRGGEPQRPIRCFGPDKLMKVWSSNVITTFCPIAAEVKFPIADDSRVHFVQPNEISDVNKIETLDFDEGQWHTFVRDSVSMYSVAAVVTVIVCLVSIILAFTLCVIKRYKEKCTPKNSINDNRVFAMNLESSDPKATLISNSDDAYFTPVYSDALLGKVLSYTERKHLHVYEKVGSNDIC